MGLEKTNVVADVCNDNKKYDWKKKKLKSLIRFQIANEIDNYNRGKKKRKNNPKETAEQVKI